MNDFIIKVENLSKKFFLKNSNDFFAIKELNFTLQKGDILGVLGSNGSGKSTLLKILGGVIKPSSGKVIIHGNLVSINELGVGFHPDLSGFENIDLFLSLNNYNSHQSSSLKKEIVEFSELKGFLDDQVKNYSSGMFIRLALSCYLLSSTDIICLDEVLSAGDVNFQKKVKNFLRLPSSREKTIIIVSHNFHELFEFCSKGLLLIDGVGKFYNKIEDAILSYKTKNKENKIFNNDFVILNSNRENSKININKIKFNNFNSNRQTEFTRGQGFEFYIEYFLNDCSYSSVEVSILIKNFLGNVVFSDSQAVRKDYCFKVVDVTKVVKAKCYFPPYFFSKGLYYFDITFVSDNDVIIEELENVFMINFENEDWESDKGFLDYCPVIRTPLVWE